MALAAGLVLALIAALGPGKDELTAEATPRGARISWDAPLECPGPGWLDRRIDAYLGRAPESEVVIVGHVHAQAAGFVLELHTEVAGVREHHRATHHDCAALVEIAASLAAISIDPLARGEAPLEPAFNPHHEPQARPQTDREGEVVVQRPAGNEHPADETPAASPRAPLPAPVSTTADSPSDAPSSLELRRVATDQRDTGEPRRAPDRRTDRRTRLLVGAVGGLGLNLFPNPAPQIRGRLGVEHGSERVAFRAELGAGAALAGRFRTSEGTAGGDLQAWDVALRPCAVPRWGIVELRTCAAFGAGQIRARGVGVVDALRRAHPWLWLAAEAGVGIRVHRNAALVLDLGADFNLYRPNFSTTKPDASYVTPIVSGHGRLGVELRFF